MEAIVAFIAAEAVNQFAFGEPIMDEATLKQSAMVGILQFLSGTIVGFVSPWLPSDWRVSDVYSRPIAVGAAYVLADMAITVDPKSMLYKFLYATGSSYIAIAAAPSIRGLIPSA